MSDYRERVGDLLSSQSEQEARLRADRDAEATQRLNARQAEERALLEKRQAIREAIDQLGVPAMLAEVNRSVWENLGTVSSSESESVRKGGYSGDVITHQRRFTLAAHIPQYIPTTTDVSRPGVVWVQTEPDRTSREGDVTFGGRSHRSIGMKKTGERITGKQDVGKDMALWVEVGIPLNQGSGATGTVWVYDTEKYNWSSTRLPESLDGLGEEYKIDWWRSRDAYLRFPAEGFDTDVLRTFIDTCLLLDSAYRLNDPISKRIAQREAYGRQIDADRGKVLSHPYDTVIRGF